MQREKRKLDAYPDNDKSDSGENGPRSLNLGKARRDIRNIQGSGHHIDETDANQVECRANGAEDQILESGGQRPPVCSLSHRDKRIGGEGHNFQKDEDIKGIAGDANTEHAGKREQVGGKEQAKLMGGHFLCNALARKEQDTCTDSTDQNKHEAAKRINDVLNPPWRRPSAQFIGNGTGCGNGKQ